MGSNVSRCFNFSSLHQSLVIEFQERQDISVISYWPPAKLVTKFKEPRNEANTNLLKKNYGCLICFNWCSISFQNLNHIRSHRAKSGELSEEKEENHNEKWFQCTFSSQFGEFPLRRHLFLMQAHLILFHTQITRLWAFTISLQLSKFLRNTFFSCPST